MALGVLVTNGKPCREGWERGEGVRVGAKKEVTVCRGKREEKRGHQPTHDTPRLSKVHFGAQGSRYKEEKGRSFGPCGAWRIGVKTGWISYMSKGGLCQLDDPQVGGKGINP